MSNSKREWGDYYYQTKRNANGKTNWVLEVVHAANQMIPSFNEVFDKETFYVFAFCLTIGAILMAVFLSKIHAGLKLLAHEDVVVESPTGSGKTLAFLLPAFTLMRRRPKWEKSEIGLLVVAPSRDLALQIAEVGRPFTDALGYSLHSTIGGKSIQADLKRIHEGVNVLIATPGRLERLIDGDQREGKLKRMLKTVEILIVDEADKFIESSFQASMNTILDCLPKQRRTGLFSATQAKDKVDLAAFALRSPSYIKLADKKDVIAPSSLSVYYSTVRADDKLMALVEFVRSVPDKKVLVFFSSCQCVQYFSAILPHFLTKRKIFAVHGKNKKGRFAQMAKFRAPGPSVMLSTDLMARGIDIADLDWVVHFDIPKKSSWLVHRAGRAGRNGREGASLLLLTPGQAAYANYIKTHEKLDMTERRIKTITELKTEQAREKIVEMASKDRELLEHGTAAYISWLKAQTTHDAYIVCKIKELDLIGHAHAFGLLRLPKTKETLDRKDVERFKRSDVDTSAIPYRNPTLEAKRKEEKGKDDGQTRRAAYKAKEAADPRAQVRKQIKQKRDRSKAAGEQKMKDERRAKKKAALNGDVTMADGAKESTKKASPGQKRPAAGKKAGADQGAQKKRKVEAMEVDE